VGASSCWTTGRSAWMKTWTAARRCVRGPGAARVGRRRDGDGTRPRLSARAASVRRVARGIRGEPGAVQAALVAALGVNGIRCARVPLEELFIEMVGGQRGEPV